MYIYIYLFICLFMYLSIYLSMYAFDTFDADITRPKQHWDALGLSHFYGLYMSLFETSHIYLWDDSVF